LIAATRSGAWFVEGLSPRAGIAVLRAAKARACWTARLRRAGRRYHRAGRGAPPAPVSGAGRRLEQVRAMVEAIPLP
jgi:MoxR-like ATPase